MESPTFPCPAGMPVQFAGQESWLARRGFDVWNELCDKCPLDKWMLTAQVADELDSLAHHKRKTQYLRAVIKAVLADYTQRPALYDNDCPVEYRGNLFRLPSKSEKVDYDQFWM